MKKIQYFALLMSVVTFLSLVGVGFSAWYNLKVVLPGKDGEITGDDNVIAAYAVDKSSSVLHCTGNIEMFKYSALSFADGDKGTIKVTYSINTSSDIFKSDPQLTFSLTTKDETTKDNVGLFGSVQDTTKSFSAKIGDTDLVKANDCDDGKTLSFTCKYSEIEKEIAGDGTFTLTYTLNIPEKYADNLSNESLKGKVGNFRKAFGQYLLSNWDSDGDGTGDKTTQIVVVAEVTIS